jgi:hypothetical protein
MNVEYTLNASTGTGNHEIANLDDEYGAGPFCRPDDDDSPNASNDWTGSWSHSNPVDGQDGVYTFEIARTLNTASAATDAQLVPGNTYEFGIAYWDPYETDLGWTDAGHYLTGCSSTWINLVLSTDAAAPPVESTVTCTAPDQLICKLVATKPTLDGNFDEWESVDGIITEIYSIWGTNYGEAKYKCVHDGTTIYFALEIPGSYRFNATSDEQCAAIGTMMKMGQNATFINMGGCIDAMELGCANGIPASCEDYKVDLGGKGFRCCCV